MADYFYQPLPSFVDPTFLCNSPTSTFAPSVIEDMSAGCYPSLESCSRETKAQILVNKAQFDSISCMGVKAECDLLVIEGESALKSADCRTEQENVSTKKKKPRVRTCSNSLQSKEAQVKKQRKCAKNEKNEASEAPPTGYVHVRARRGQATDSHSLAERVRREKISERMKLLQDLVPGCDKVTGKALLLDEIINYVQSLQNQVEFLSMKLASLSPFPSNFSAPSPENRGYLPQLEGRELSYFLNGANMNHQISFNSSIDSTLSGLQSYEFGENELANQRAINNGTTQDRASTIWNLVSHRQSVDELEYNLNYFQQ